MPSFTLKSNARALAPRRAARAVRPAASFRPVFVNAASTETLDKVRSIISEQLGTDLDKVTGDAKFLDLGADSLDTVEIMMALEEQFDITEVTEMEIGVVAEHCKAITSLNLT